MSLPPALDDLQHILIARQEAVATVTINRPQVLNALDRHTLDELRRAMVAFGQDDDVRAVVVTGAGEKAFVAGADITELARLTPTEAGEYARQGQQVLDLVERLGKPVIAAINGFALGGGCELAMACTLRVAAETARLGQPEIKLGLLPGFAGTQRLPRLVGRGRALELLLTGEPIAAAEAHRIGLVNRVVAPADLMAEAQGLAAVLAARPMLAVRATLDAVLRGADMSLADAQAFEAARFGLLAATEDMREGTQAFVEKRQASFKGR
jgi:enoyl-CoA hydratase